MLHVVVEVLSTVPHLTLIISMPVLLLVMTAPIVHTKATSATSATAITSVVLEASSAEATSLEPSILVKLATTSLVVHHILLGWTLIKLSVLVIRFRLEVI